MTDADIHDNPESHRYELPVGGEVAVVIYNLSGQNLMITETLVPVAQGQRSRFRVTIRL